MKVVILTSLFLAFNALLVYLTSIIAVHGIRKSISDSNYFLKKPFKLVFEIVMWICGLSVMLTGIFIKSSPDWMIVSGGLCIFLVGVFSDFKRSILLRVAHYISAIGGFVMLGLSFFFCFGSFNYTLVIAMSALIAFVFAYKRIWCLELTLSAEVFAGLFYFAHIIM